jgi:AAA family ATP:ADP antiporter
VVGLWIAAAAVLQLAVLLGVKLEARATQLALVKIGVGRREAVGPPAGGWSGVLQEVLWPIVRDLYRSPYLLGTTAYICLVALAGTTVYSLLNQQVGLAITKPPERVAFFASVNLAVQLLTVVLQGVLSARLLSWWGVGRTLMLLPLAYVLIFGLFGWRLNLTLVTGAFILASSLAYGLTVPARELLFTVVDKSAKYRTKAVIDTVLFRSFDWLASVGIEQALKQQWLVGYLLGLVAVGVGWCGLGGWLGQRQQQQAEEQARNKSAG